MKKMARIVCVGLLAMVAAGLSGCGGYLTAISNHPFDATISKAPAVAQVSISPKNTGDVAGALEVLPGSHGTVIIRGQTNFKEYSQGAPGLGLKAGYGDIGYYSIYMILDPRTRYVVVGRAKIENKPPTVQFYSNNSPYINNDAIPQASRLMDMYPYLAGAKSNASEERLAVVNGISYVGVKSAARTRLPDHYGIWSPYTVKAFQADPAAVKYYTDLAYGQGCSGGKLNDAIISTVLSTGKSTCPDATDGAVHLYDVIRVSPEFISWLKPLPGMMSKVIQDEVRYVSPAVKAYTAIGGSAGMYDSIEAAELRAMVKLAETPEDKIVKLDPNKPVDVVFFRVPGRPYHLPWKNTKEDMDAMRAKYGPNWVNHQNSYHMTYNEAVQVVDEAWKTSTDHRWSMFFVDIASAESTDLYYFRSPSQSNYNPPQAFNVFGVNTGFMYEVLDTPQKSTRHLRWIDGDKKQIDEELHSEKMP